MPKQSSIHTFDADGTAKCALIINNRNKVSTYNFSWHSRLPNPSAESDYTDIKPHIAESHTVTFSSPFRLCVKFLNWINRDFCTWLIDLLCRPNKKLEDTASDIHGNWFSNQGSHVYLDMKAVGRIFVRDCAKEFGIEGPGNALLFRHNPKAEFKSESPNPGPLLDQTLPDDNSDSLPPSGGELDAGDSAHWSCSII